MKISQEISGILVQNRVINPEERSICEYGIDVILTWGIELLCILLLSLCIGNCLDTIFYFVSFIPIRLYGGGYHADSRIRCFCILIAVYAMFSLLTLYIPLEDSKWWLVILSMFSVVPIYLWAPLKNKNKNISEKERRCYRKICIILWGAEIAIILFVILLGKYNCYAQSFLVGLISATLALVAGKIKDYFIGGTNQ
ncbi:MAG: accessory gene regulator B family protein [bacterium]|nr:accessory gene regulator B family protein [bacterium]